MIFCRTFLVSKFVKIIYVFCFHSFQEIETLHNDEVVSLLISGCEIVVYSYSPMAVIFHVLLLNC